MYRQFFADCTSDYHQRKILMSRWTLILYMMSMPEWWHSRKITQSQYRWLWLTKKTTVNQCNSSINITIAKEVDFSNHFLYPVVALMPCLDRCYFSLNKYSLVWVQNTLRVKIKKKIRELWSRYRNKKDERHNYLRDFFVALSLCIVLLTANVGLLCVKS